MKNRRADLEVSCSWGLHRQGTECSLCEDATHALGTVNERNVHYVTSRGGRTAGTKPTIAVVKLLSKLRDFPLEVKQEFYLQVNRRFQTRSFDFDSPKLKASEGIFG